MRACPGTLAAAEGARRLGLAGLDRPAASARARRRSSKRSRRSGSRASPARRRRCAASGPSRRRRRPPVAARLPAPDLCDVRGHAAPIEALTVAAAGAHHVLLSGPPGTGKTMLARRLPSILPPLEPDEAIEVTRIHSVARPARRPRPRRRPAVPRAAPHDSAAGLVGGGRPPSPGRRRWPTAASCSSTSWRSSTARALESLRQPLEDGHVTIARDQRALRFPTRFSLVAATNPCPVRPRRQRLPLRRGRPRSLPRAAVRARCSTASTCSSPSSGRRPTSWPPTLSRPRTWCWSASARRASDSSGAAERSTGTSRRPRCARPRAADAGAERALRALYERGAVSARGRDRLLRVARTIADLDDCEHVERGHVLRAASYRQDEPPAAAAA